MGDSIKWCMEREEEREHEEYKRQCAIRKRNVTGVDLDVAIGELLTILRTQQLSRKVWDKVDALNHLWFGKV